MSNSRTALIDQLSHDLPAVKPLGSTGRLALMWSTLTISAIACLLVLTGPVRDAVLLEFLGFPRYTLGMLVGLASIAFFSVGIFRLLRPGMKANSLFLMGGLCLCTWMGLQVAEIWAPALPSSLDDKRSHCFLETILFSLPAIALGWFISRKGFVLNRGALLTILGLSAGLITAWLMQVVCMYEAKHNLLFHFGPVAITVACVLGFQMMVQKKSER